MLGIINRIKGELKFNGTFTCDKCRATGVGGTEHISVDVVGTLDLSRVVPKNFPIGWAAYGIGHYTCDKCLGELQ